MTVLQTADQRSVEILTCTPANKTSANAIAVVTGSEMDMRAWRSLSYTIKIATNNVDWSVWGANASDYSDEVAVLASATVAAAAGSSYAVAQAPYAYYRVKVESSVDGNHGVATVRGIAKG